MINVWKELKDSLKYIRQIEYLENVVVVISAMRKNKMDALIIRREAINQKDWKGIGRQEKGEGESQNGRRIS